MVYLAVITLKYFNVSDEDIFILSSSKGNQVKWFKDNYFIKQDTMGYESIAEVIAYIFAKCTNIKSIPYNLCVINNEICGCYSKNLLKNGESLITLNRIINTGDRSIFNHYGTYKFVEEVINLCSKVLGIDRYRLELYFSYMCKFDAIILNEDRHLNNIAFIKSGNNYKLCPLFDNGLSLLSNEVWYKMGISVLELIGKVKSVTFSSSFDEQCAYFSNCPKIKVDFNKLVTELYTLNAPFKYNEFQRAVEVLLIRLKQTEGVYWSAI